jgi:hypothetical protein
METQREILDSLAKEESDEGIYETITLSPEKFQEFVDAIDKPMEPNSKLRELLTTPSVIELGVVETFPNSPKENN